MDKFVAMRFEGKADQFFSVNYQILDSDHKVIDVGQSSLPGCPELITSIKDWRAAYHADVRSRRLERKETYVNNSSEIDHRKLTNDLKTNLNNWLNSLEFQFSKEKLFARLNPREVILVGIGTDDAELKYAPWHLWSFFDTFPKSDYTLLRPNFSKRDNDFAGRKKESRSKRNIMAIIGDSTGIDTKEDRTIIENISGVRHLQILSEPSRAEVVEFLWDSRDTDILFFAGHGKKDQNQGRICINSEETLGIEEIRSCLQKRIQEGLQLAIFNSCDGLELGEAIADLHIPQAIVMKEAVPDDIAQRFLKDFLKEFSEGVPLVQALRQTRNKLKDQERDYPYASWLPVLYCNPTEPLLQWYKPNLVQKYPWRSGLAASCLVGLVGLIGMSTISPQPPAPIPKPTIAVIPEISVYAKYFQLPLPDNWKVEDGGNVITGDDIHLYLSSDQNVSISLNIKEIKSKNNESLTLDNYTEEFINKATSAWNDFILNEKNLQILTANRRSSRVYFSTTYESIKYKKSTTILLHNNKAYTITYSSPENLFANYESMANKITDSLIFFD